MKNSLDDSAKKVLYWGQGEGECLLVHVQLMAHLLQDFFFSVRWNDFSFQY